MATLTKGYDLDYVWRQARTNAQRDAAGYYLRAAEDGGEPPGRWWGPGAQALGFEQGQIVERGPYDLLFGQRKAPDGTQLCRPPQGGQKTADLYAHLLSAEPHATAERKRELRIEAAAQARQSPLYFDLTISFSKSVSVFHASLGENARLAAQAGDAAATAYWSGLVAETDQMIWQAVHAGFAYFQCEAGYTRTGSHARRVDGRETGQWHEAELTVAHWLQHTSRDGDMQLHVHSQIAHVARTVTDGKWRAPDSLGYNEHIGAVAAIVSQHLEEALTRRFGLGWVARDDGHGFEIAGVSGELMRVFSSRRVSITADLRVRARKFEARYGRKPSQRELAQLAQQSNFRTRTAKPDGALDFARLHADWADRLARTLGVPLASVAPSVWHSRSGAGTSGPARAGPGLSKLELSRAAQKALALAQQDKSTFTRADLIRHLGRVLPRTGQDPAAAAALLEDLADRALASQFGDVVCLEAPEAAPAPPGLLRADGRSVYQRHGGVRYATQVQLNMEERMAAQACRRAAPALLREEAARALGRSVTQLGAALNQPARNTHAEITPTGLRADQAAAVFSVLTDSRRVSVINAPAGSGKTRVLAEAGRIWAAARNGQVIGITPSQSARNTLGAQVPDSYNTAQFLGHLPGERGARGPVTTGPGALLLVDEASMISSQDMADLISHAEASGSKLILAGDTGQLQAVENGGGLSLLASALGYVQLAEPVRFRADWERAASLRLRRGAPTVLADYDEHGRILGGIPEQITDTAAQAYVALTLQGKDTLLMVSDHARRRELSRRIRDDLIHLGLVRTTPTTRIADGTQASAGDLIVCTNNDHHVVAGEPGRTLANGDLLRIEAITRNGLLVRRALDADPHTGARRWTDRPFLYGNYETSELGYAVTDHVAQSRTVHTGLTLITGTEDRQHAYVALSRGTHTNRAYVCTLPPATADPAPGPQPAPELNRFDRITAQRDAQPGQAATTSGNAAALGVLAEVLKRDGQQLSATETQRRNLSSADHLAVLNAIWTAETAGTNEQRYTKLLAAALPPGHQGELSHRAKWLWRTLRAAELSGLEPGEVLRTAVAERDLTGTRDVAAVTDARLRHRITTLVPQPPRPWSEQVPDIADPHRRTYIRTVAQLMDARKTRIGEHAAEHPPSWAVNALGPVPQDPRERLDWQQRASSIGAYRELHGYDHPTDPIGPEPTGDSPDKRAAWHEAFAVLRPPDGPDVRALPDGSLLHMRDTYPIETAWAPPWVGTELRQARLGAAQAQLAAVRAKAEATAASRSGRNRAAERHAALAASYQAMTQTYQERETVFAGVMQDRTEWEHATAHQRRLAIAADAELRRRHPDQSFEPLRSAEPEPKLDTDDNKPVLTPSEQAAELTQRISELAAGHRAFASRLADRQSLMLPDENPAYSNLGQAFPSWPRLDKDALLQPPVHQIPPSARVLERARVPQADLEAAN